MRKRRATLPRLLHFHPFGMKENATDGERRSGSNTNIQVFVLGRIPLRVFDFFRLHAVELEVGKGTCL